MTAPDAESLQKLQALGYLGGTESTPPGPRRDPKDMIAMWEREIGRANKLVADGKHEEALPLLKGLLNITLQDPGLWALLSLAQSSALRFEEALESRMRAIDLQPLDPDHWIQAARLHYSIGDLEAAQVALAEAERLDPAHGEIYLVRAVLALGAGRYAEAVALCQEGRARDPVRHTVTTWALQGKVYEAMGRLDNAKSAYESAYAADPLNPVARYGLGVRAERDGEHRRAVELLSRIGRGPIEWLESRNTLARAYLSLGQSAAALRVMRELVAAIPNNAQVHRNLGNLLFAMGRLTEAAESYRKATELDPRDAHSQHRLGLVLKELGGGEG